MCMKLLKAFDVFLMPNEENTNQRLPKWWLVSVIKNVGGLACLMKIQPANCTKNVSASQSSFDIVYNRPTKFRPTSKLAQFNAVISTNQLTVQGQTG